MTALQALLLSAGLAGAPAQAPAIPEIQAGISENAPQEVGRAPLDAVLSGQRRATIFREVDGVRLGFNLALGPDGYLRLRVRAGRTPRAFSIPALREGVQAVWSGKAFRLSIAGDEIGVSGPSGAAERLSLTALVEALYELGLHAAFPPVVYTMLYEDGSLLPEASGLLRKDGEGRFWISYHRRDGARLHWFVAINGRLFGSRIEDRDLVFYRKPVPASALSTAPSWRPAFP